MPADVGQVTERKDHCPECDSLVDVWADNSDGITVNFRCDNSECLSGKPPWDTPPPTTKDEQHVILRRLKQIKENYSMRIGLSRAAGDIETTRKLERMRETLSRARKAFLQKEGMT